MSILRSMPPVRPMSFLPPPMPDGLNYNPIAMAQAAAQAQAQEALKRNGLGDGSAPAGSQQLPVGGEQGASVTPGTPPATAAAGSAGRGLLGSIGRLFGAGGSGGGDMESIAKMLAMLS